MGGRARKQNKTQEEIARERAQSRQLDEEIQESEQRFKALARGKLGARSLLGGGAAAVQAPGPKGVYGKNSKKRRTQVADYNEPGYGGSGDR